jgi:hypothetical protein
MPDEFTSQEQDLLANEPADAAVFVGEGEPSADEADDARPSQPEPPVEEPPVPQG